MTFRIRKDAEDAAWQQGEQAYRQHLEQFVKSSDEDLWKYFYWDFFHDGSVRSLEMGPDLKKVVMRLECSNIERIFSNGRREYLNVSFTFTCTFENVVCLHIEEDPPTQGYDVQDADALFLAAEVNTSPLLKAPVDDDGDRFSSLLIQLLAHDTLIWMEIVFSELRVEPDEPVAFSLMEASPDFDVPTWSPDPT
jgi:hypothetical protein